MIHACAIGPKISLLRRKWDLQRLRVLPKCMQLEKDSDFWTGSMMVPNMSVITHYLILISRKIQLPSTLGSTSWLRLGLLSKLEEIFLPEDSMFLLLGWCFSRRAAQLLFLGLLFAAFPPLFQIPCLPLSWFTSAFLLNVFSHTFLREVAWEI